MEITMSKHLKIVTGLVLCLSVLLLFEATNLSAQLAPEVAQLGYADTIFVTGKLVSMDDYSNSTSTGSLYQAVAVKGTRIMKLGTSAQIRALAGPDTTTYDLQGRTVIPALSSRTPTCTAGPCNTWIGWALSTLPTV